jgi:hypothetical protein
VDSFHGEKIPGKTNSPQRHRGYGEVKFFDLPGDDGRSKASSTAWKVRGKLIFRKFL